MLHAALLLLPLLADISYQLSLTEADLRAYDGTDDSKPIYLAINGTIYDVSASPAFYGPGGHYHHFTGRDASRAWVTECWDSEDQLTWRMDGIEKMFMPRYLDEELEKFKSGGDFDLDLGGMIPREQIVAMADAALKRLGTVTDSQKAARRKEDEAEAKQKVHDTLAHWVAFFANNAKYEAVGAVVYDEDGTPAPPALCESAMKKRQIKGGLLDSLMDVSAMGRKNDPAAADKEMPDFVKARLDEQQKRETGDYQAKDEL